MNCPEHLVIKAFGDRLYIWMYWYDVPRKNIPKLVWLNLLRYSLVLHIANGKTIVINDDGRWNRLFQNFLYKHIRPKMCRWFGIHQRFSFRGGDKRCHHCNTGED